VRLSWHAGVPLDLLDAIRARSTSYASTIHGERHWQGVAAAGSGTARPRGR
jgi:hypothetical protein